MFNRFSVGRRGFSLGLASIFIAASRPAQAAAEPGAGSTAAAGSDFKGTLYPIGGAADSSLRRFAELAGGSAGKITILPHSSSSPKETAEELANTFMALGVRDTELILPGENRKLPECTAIFMSGGDQSRMMRLISKEMISQIREFLKKGGLVGGTSAGAAAVSSQMIAGGMSDGLPKSKSLMISEGLGLLPSYMVDTHVGARARHDRLMVGLSMEPGLKGIGLDEDTAVEIKDGKATVRGAGVAHVYRRAENFNSNLPETPEGRTASVQNMIYSIFPAGETFEL